jgi:hypothetical protein
VEDALDDDCVVVGGGVEDQVTTVHRNPHARSVLFA